MFEKSLLIVWAGALFLPIFPPASLSGEAQAQPTSAVHLAFLLANSPQADTLLNLFAANLKAGDHLIIWGRPMQRSWVVKKSKETKKLMPAGVNIFSAIGFVNIDTLEAIVPTLSQEIDWVVYDYEGGPGFSPEFTRELQVSLTFFDRGLAASHRQGFRFMITLPYGQLRSANWNWGEVARHADGITIQFQAFLKNPEILVPEATKVFRQIDSLSAGTLTMIQLSLIPTRGTITDNLRAMEQLQNEPIDAFLLFYRPTQADTIKNFFIQLSTAVREHTASPPAGFVLWQNYPNPFPRQGNFVQAHPARKLISTSGSQAVTTIQYELFQDEKVTLKIFNPLGQEVRTLINGRQQAGLQAVVWDGRDDAGQMMRPGVYVYRLQAGNHMQSRKMMLLATRAAEN